MQQPSIDIQPSASNRKWLTALVPVMAMGALTVVFWGDPTPVPLVVKSTTTSAPDIVLPISTTFVVNTTTSGEAITLRGRLTVFNPQIIAAPSAGMVSRVLVKPGEMVKAGETIAMISNQAIPALEKSRIARQEQAEAAQEAANRQQSILQGKLEQEKRLLEAANQRVDRAAKRLADARALLRRLQNGEKVPRSEINTTKQATPTPDAAPSKATQAERASATAIADAQQQVEHTTKIAAQKWQILHVLLTRQLAAKSAPDNADSKVAPTAEQIEAARAEAKDAQTAADKSRIKLYTLTSAKSAQKIDKPKPAVPADTSKSTFITEADATRIATAALQESNDALAEVKSIQYQINRYEAPVKSANTNFEAATSNLENTQRSLFDNPVKVPMIPVVAKSDGVVHRLATLAMHVEAGDEIASIVAPNLLALNVPDNSGIWKRLTVNSTFEVKVQPTSDVKIEVATDARLISITPSTRPGQPAVLHIQVFNPVAKSPIKPKAATTDNTIEKPVMPPRVFTPGMVATASIQPVEKISIPRRALHLDANKKYQVAVLKPLGANATFQKYAVEWISVSVKDVDAASPNVVIVSGLKEQDRIALEPEKIYTLTQAKRVIATVQLSNS